MENQSAQRPNITYSAPSKPPVKFGLSIAIIIICLVAATVAGYWIKTEPGEQSPINFLVKRSADSSANWQTYRNEEYGFEVKYPKDYKTQEIPETTPTGLMIFLPRGNSIVHEIDNSIINIDLPEDCMFKSDALEEENGISFAGTKEINGVNFYYYKNYPKYIGGYCGMSSGCNHKDVYRTLYKEKCYEIEYDRLDRVFFGPDDYRMATNEEMKVPEIFNQILSTFKFLK